MERIAAVMGSKSSGEKRMEMPQEAVMERGVGIIAMEKPSRRRRSACMARCVDSKAITP